MSDSYILGQSQKHEMEANREEVRIDLVLEPNPYKEKAVVVGNITDVFGNLIENALVKIMDHNHNPLYHAITDENGHYHISDITTNIELHIYAIKAGFELAEGTPFTLSPKQTQEVNLSLNTNLNETTSIITGHVINTEDNPIEDLDVVLLNEENEEQIVVNISSTNSYGQFVFANVENGDYLVQLSGEGYQTSLIEAIIDESSSIIEINTVLQDSPVTSYGTINGIVKDASDRAVVGATVVLFEIIGEEPNVTLVPIRQTQTINDGVYLFGQVSVGRYLIKANKEE